MKVSFRRSDDLALIEHLHHRVMPGDDVPDISFNKSAMWIGYATEKGFDDEIPVAFCIARKLLYESAVFLERAGVLPGYRGANLQRRMIYLRERWARNIGVNRIITYTLYENFVSTANLIKCGYHFYRPHEPWAGKVNYFQKKITG